MTNKHIDEMVLGKCSFCTSAAYIEIADMDVLLCSRCRDILALRKDWMLLTPEFMQWCGLHGVNLGHPDDWEMWWDCYCAGATQGALITAEHIKSSVVKEQS